MDDIIYLNLLRSVAIIASITGGLIGLDLILGARLVNFLKRILEKPYNFDKIIINPKVKLILGIAFLVLSAIIILLLKRV